jgi:hypothetical protein
MAEAPTEDKKKFWAERRRHPRIQARVRIRTDGTVPGTLTTTNISLGGAFGETSRQLEVGSSVNCVMEPPRRVGLKGVVEAKAAVLRANTTENGARRVHFAAIQFTRLEKPGHGLLRDLLQRLSGVDYPD